MTVLMINRGFWPESDVPGESLLAAAECMSKEHTVIVATQSKINIQLECRRRGRAENIEIRTSRLFTSSSSGVIYRIIEAIYFSLWILIQVIKIKPKFIYVATDPPMIVPFIVALVSKIYCINYTYHVQDIHPEATNIILNVPKIIFKILVLIDNYTIKNANKIVTLNDEMANYLRLNRKCKRPIFILKNASAYPIFEHERKTNTVIFCGNAGRLQEIPLIADAIDLYLTEGGRIKFTFLGAGLYSSKFKNLSKKWESVRYMSYLPQNEAIEIVSQHEWGLVPIKSEILKFAFPSKTSAYVAAGCKILAICQQDSSLGRWVKNNKKGLVSEPIIRNIVDKLFEMENCCPGSTVNPMELEENYSINNFALKLQNIIFSNDNIV